jgi:glucosamine-6-phosphate isomerase
MRLIITETDSQMGEIAAQHLLGIMYTNQRRVNLSITAGSTPVSVYEALVPYVKNKNYLNHVHYYNFDEIPYKQEDREGITISNLRKLYFTPANISEQNIHILDHTNYHEQDKRIDKDGGLDTVLLGIGEDGHYCGNLPGTTTINDFTTKVINDDKIRERLKKQFDDPTDVPDYYVTMGPRSIMSAESLILIANGKHKADVIKSFIEGDISKDLPASILKLHPNLTVIIDKKAASKLKHDYTQDTQII